MERPAKRQRTDSDLDIQPDIQSLDPSQPPPSRTSSSSSRPTKPASSSSTQQLAPLPAPHLLISLPSLLMHPPTHPLHPTSLMLSLTSVKKLLSASPQSSSASLNPDVECRAWVSWAEIGMCVIDGGWHEVEECREWAGGIVGEVQTAISQGLLIAQKNASLRLYKHHLNLLHARLSLWQHNHKFARTILRRLLSSFTPIDPPSLIYITHLTLIHHLLAAPSSPSPSSAPSSPSNPLPQDIQAALDVSQELEALALKNGHVHVVLLVRVLRLGTLVSCGLWTEVARAVSETETALGLSYIIPSTSPSASDPPPTHGTPNAGSKRKRAPDSTQEFVDYENPFETTMAIHTLVWSITWFLHVGDAANVSPRVSHLHSFLDSGALERGGREGRVEIALPPGPPLLIQTTHPRLFFFLSFLLSAVSKRDVVGRKPKRRVFASEGLRLLELDERRGRAGGEGGESGAPDMLLPPWASYGELHEVEQRLARVKADLISELVAVAIMRSEFDVAQQHLTSLLTHTLNFSLFPSYAARITLHHAHLYHGLLQWKEAVRCYKVAGWVARRGGASVGSAMEGDAGKEKEKGKTKAKLTSKQKDEPEHVMTEGERFVYASASAGEVLLRIGIRAKAIARARARQRERDRKGKGRARGRSEMTESEFESEMGYSESSDYPPSSHFDESESEDELEGEGDGGRGQEVDDLAAEISDEELAEMGKEAAEACRGLGGTLEAVGHLVLACLCGTREIIGAKAHLKAALSLATKAQDNHLRALILALVSAHYLHTASEHAQVMLRTCEQLAAGLGAVAKATAKGAGKPVSKGKPVSQGKPVSGTGRAEGQGANASGGAASGGSSAGVNVGVGHAPLRLWVGERFVELFRREGDEERARKREGVNAELGRVVEGIERWGREVVDGASNRS
ncbi:uncharacterized protein STEHIDRAFT_167950 [Stereum hirsutum FP-91666 SS1]|uniref:uncharacterized protein n=1 Tax=Stereum hirsutum (strain FP-91666) TaxID=721885 RepID=UPI0004409E8B|nr:uncharacterized protein STEHIDRAFT_167950 [Stereum hirsutum FP-91666 SS1]EIM87097.1 hypothetical protein STEHIDRAFT_167950 [Stereum hirsutum FP-91666 SS1]